MSSRRQVSLFLIACLFALGCASSAQLTRQSQRELSVGNAEKAYEKARKALLKDPDNTDARIAMAAAASRLLEDGQARVHRIAQADTVAAARYLPRVEAVRAEVARFRLAVPTDPAFDHDASRIRAGAARFYYATGERSLKAGYPKRAHGEFVGVLEFAPGYRDVAGRIAEAREQGLARVVILPFENQTDVRGLSKELADRMHDEMEERLARDFTFTELIPRDQVYARVTVAQLDRLSREDALRIGQRLKADLVVRGRYYGLRSSSNLGNFEHTIYRKTVEKLPDGSTQESYRESEFQVVRHERDVSVHLDLEVLEVAAREPVSSRTEVMEAHARAIWSDFRPEGDCKMYVLTPPAAAKAEPARAKKSERRWKEGCGTWTLADLLESCRSGSARARYKTTYRREFLTDTRQRPVFLGELPDEDELAWVALDGSWRPLVATLQELDATDRPLLAGGGE